MTARLPAFFISTVFLVLAAAPAVRAQDDAAMDYLPLAVGNAWTFYTLLDPPNAPIDTTFFGPFVITEEIVVKDTVYYRYPLFFADTDTVRTDTAGRIYGRVQGRDVLLFDVTLPDSATYLYAPRSTPYPFVVTVRRDQTVAVSGGRFTNALSFLFDIPEAVDDARRFDFAPGVGLLVAVSGMGEFVLLHEAVVDGMVVTSTEPESLPEGFALEAYPNPSRTQATFRFSPSRPGRARLVIYDLLGREVATLVDAYLEAGPRRVVWNADGLPAGTYFARLSTAGRSQTVTLVRLP